MEKSYDKKHGADLRKVHDANQKAKGLVSYSIYLKRQVIDRLKRISRRLRERDSTYLRTWTRTSVVTRAINSLYSQMFTSTTQTLDPVVFEGDCTDKNIRVGYVPVFRYRKIFLHAGLRHELVCDTKEEAIDRARAKTGELRADFVGPLEIRYSIGENRGPKIVDQRKRQK